MSEPVAVSDGALAQVEAMSEPAAPVPDPVTPAGGMQDDENGGSDGSDNEEAAGGANGDGSEQANGTAGSSSKKKKKKKSNKKKKAGGAAANGAAGGVHAVMPQTEPPTIGLTKIYINGQFPVGQECEYVGE